MQVQYVYITFVCKTLLDYGYSFLHVHYFVSSSLLADVQKPIFQAASILSAFSIQKKQKQIGKRKKKKKKEIKERKGIKSFTG